MNATSLVLALSLASLPVLAQETKETPVPKETAKPGTTPEELEAAFKTTMTAAVMSGRWCMLDKGRMGEDKEDKYTIVGVEKNADGTWTIKARIQYGNFDLVAPVPVKVKWAGDTAVIIVDNMGLPGTAKYSARVLIYGDTYSGTWSGGNHGGLMHGVITRDAKPRTEEKAEEKK